MHHVVNFSKVAKRKKFFKIEIIQLHPFDYFFREKKTKFHVIKDHEDTLFQWTKQICVFFLHYHFERKARSH
jgi:hypothetical protein